MGKIAFVFSGQGDQHPGMGRDLFENYPAAKDVFDMCDRIRPGTSSQCFDGTEDELKETKNTQPCLFAMELAAARTLIGKGILPDAVAGFSLGEVVAASVSGLFQDEDGFRLVCRRGELMQRESEKYDTAMAAVVRLSADEVRAVCEKYPDVYPVNFNCPGNITVSGLASQMPAFFADVKAAGGRALPLKVKGAFHSPFMKDAADAFAGEVAAVKTGSLTIPLYSDMTAQPYTDDVVSLLSKQICSPVQWEKLIRNMIDAGIDTFVEIGPGKTRANMIKKMSADVKPMMCLACLKVAEAC